MSYDGIEYVGCNIILVMDDAGEVNEAASDVDEVDDEVDEIGEIDDEIVEVRR
jgi:hypothetical protein